MLIKSESAAYLRRSSQPPAVDTTGEIDYGHIDVFRPSGDGASTTWELVGDWGDAMVSQPLVRVEFQGDR